MAAPVSPTFINLHTENRYRQVAFGPTAQAATATSPAVVANNGTTNAVFYHTPGVAAQYTTKGLRGVVSAPSGKTYKGVWYVTDDPLELVRAGTAVYSPDSRNATNPVNVVGEGQDSRDFVNATAVYFVPATDGDSPNAAGSVKVIY